MPWRLIIFIVICAVFVAFITFNLENKCDISFGFAQIREVPVFVTIFASFVFGLFCALPLSLHIKKRKREISENENKNADTAPAAIEDSQTNEKIKQDAQAAKKRFFSGRKGG